MKRVFLFTVALLCVQQFAGAQNDEAVKRIAVGVQGGIVQPTNESSWGGHQSISETFGVFSLFRNGIGAGLSPELNIGYAQNKSIDTISFSHYSTTAITADIRLRWYPLAQDATFAPYLSVGVGLIMPSNKLPVVVSDPEFKKDNASVCFPMTFGLTQNVTDNLSLDLNLGWMLSISDDINPAHDNGNDGWFAAKIGLAYSFGPIEVDSDGDLLSDKQEHILGTDPLKADTDGDGLTDGEEVNIYHTDPLNTDTDDGGINDGAEIKAGTNPLIMEDDIESIGVGETVQIRNIEFTPGFAEISKKSERILEKVLKVLTDKRNMILEIAGHTDNTGEHDFSMQLSNDRAKAVKDWLVARGVADSRLITQGYGPDKPTKTNETAEGRRRNRRVEFKRTK